MTGKLIFVVDCHWFLGEQGMDMEPVDDPMTELEHWETLINK